MDSPRRALAVLAALGVMLVLGAGPAAGQAPTVVQTDLTGVVDPIIADHVRAVIDDANAHAAEAVLIRIDTPGGLESSMREITQAILNSGVPVICWTGPSGARAASAGTFIMLSCPVAAMAAGTNIGAAHPVGIAGAIEQDKVTNDAAAYIRSLAQTTGRNADWAEQAVRESVSVSAAEALDLNVIDLIAPNVPALLSDLDGTTVTEASGDTVKLELAGATVRIDDLGALRAFLHALLDPNLAFLFFWLGLAFLVAELFVPGGVIGTLGAIMLVLAIVAFGMLPVEIVGVALLMASLVFFILELKHPGVGALALGGVTCVLLGGLFLFDRNVGVRVSPWLLALVSAGAAGFFLIVVRAAMRLRHRRVVTRNETLIGQEGTVTQPLNPRGIVQVAAEVWSAESVSGAIERGERVRVVAMDGLRLKVEPARDHAPAGHKEGGGS